MYISSGFINIQIDSGIFEWADCEIEWNGGVNIKLGVSWIDRENERDAEREHIPCKIHCQLDLLNQIKILYSSQNSSGISIKFEWIFEWNLIFSQI